MTEAIRHNESSRVVKSIAIRDQRISRESDTAYAPMLPHASLIEAAVHDTRYVLEHQDGEGEFITTSPRGRRHRANQPELDHYGNQIRTSLYRTVTYAPRPQGLYVKVEHTGVIRKDHQKDKNHTAGGRKPDHVL